VLGRGGGDWLISRGVDRIESDGVESGAHVSVRTYTDDDNNNYNIHHHLQPRPPTPHSAIPTPHTQDKTRQPISNQSSPPASQARTRRRVLHVDEA
jgi:hypothetical protein